MIGVALESELEHDATSAGNATDAYPIPDGTSLPSPALPACGACRSAMLGSRCARLSPPSITPASETLPANAFPLQVTLTRNENDPVGATIYYSTDPSVWKLYTDPISVEPGTILMAYTSSEDPVWEDSDPAFASYLSESAAE